MSPHDDIYEPNIKTDPLKMTTAYKYPYQSVRTTQMCKPDSIVSAATNCANKHEDSVPLDKCAISSKKLARRKMKALIHDKLRKSSFGRRLLLGRKLFKKEEIDKNMFHESDYEGCVELYLEHRAARKLTLLRQENSSTHRNTSTYAKTLQDSLQLSKNSDPGTPSSSVVDNIGKLLLQNVAKQKIRGQTVAR